uniref:DNA methyltransferase 1-associated protein 1 n=1 Tax=Arundo donax TaxID=35708 RepID=A0A0A9E4W3_ARUDO
MQLGLQVKEQANGITRGSPLEDL